MKILVTGGAGFLGSHLTDVLVKQGHTVSIIDNLSTGKKDNINKKSFFFNTDIKSSSLGSIVKKINPEVVFHFAAQTSISKSMIDPRLDFETNLIATQNLITSVSQTKVRKIVFASSAAVYGETSKLPTQEGDTKTPFSVYGISKFAAEFLLNSLSKQTGITCTSLRFSNVYGPRQDSSGEGGVVSIFINSIIRNKEITIYSDGNQTRDFIYVKDVITACLKSSNNNISGVFNVSTSQETKIQDLAKILENLIDQKVKVKFKKRDFIEASRSGLSNSKFKKLSNWQQKYNLLAGLKETVKYFRKYENRNSN